MKKYVPKHRLNEYLKFQNENECMFHKLDEVGTGLNNHKKGTTIEMFCIKSQWVEGRSVEECLDLAMSYKKTYYPAPKWFKDSIIRAYSAGIDEYLKIREKKKPTSK